LAVDGPRIVNAASETVALRGYNVGGWLNMENFLTGYPGSESAQRAALRAVLGETRYELFFKTLYESFFADDDAAFLASLGLNCVRIPFNYRRFEDDNRPFEYTEKGFRELDRAIAICARHGLYAILDLHAVPGSQNQHWHSDNGTHVAMFWQHIHFQERATRLWVALASRYRDEPAVGGYNLLNEPGDPTGKTVKSFYDRTVAAIREVDSRHIILLDGNRYATDFSAFSPGDYGNVVFVAHDYHLPGFADGGPYPGISRGTYVDRDIVRDTFRKRTQFMRDAGLPIWIGECGPLFPLHSPNLQERYNLLADELHTYNEHGAGWALWAYKDVGGQGVVYARPQSPWMQAVAPIIEKKARLGVDGWGTTDAHIRDVMEPIEARFAAEFPNFDPYPFGRADFIATLVRSIMFAEPMVLDFARRFDELPLGDDGVVALAQSFSFANCTIREPLARIIAEAARAPAIPSR
jgi:hypothetical protein